jgi:hypothetical protein
MQTADATAHELDRRTARPRRPRRPAALRDERRRTRLPGLRRQALKGSSAQVPLGCDGTLATGCDGAVVLLRSSVKAGRRLRRKDVLASAPFRIGRSGIVAMKLSKADRRTLRTKRRLKARLVVRSRQGATIARRVTLRMPKKRAATRR